ncbi:MAG: hypothetical protein E6J20_19345 [Chloroflexi bacterium]|nr:MAG: hypothetical protein E6J20_19345 [Chloroflexota bacterium]
MKQYSYLFTILAFGGGSLVLIWLRGHLRRYARFVLFFVVVTVPFAYFESFGLRWRAWAYNPARTIHRHFLGAEVESYLFMAFVSAAVASATLVYATREEARRRKDQTRARTAEEAADGVEAVKSGMAPGDCMQTGQC